MAGKKPAAGANPFSLEKKKGVNAPGKTFKSTTYTKEEQATLLNGYVEVPQEFWPLIRYGSHVRYITKEDAFRIGGFVAANPFDSRGDAVKPSKRYFKLQNSFGQKSNGYAQWMVSYDDVKSIYTKPDATAMVVQAALKKAVEGLNTNIRKIIEHTKGLEARIAALEARR